MSFFGTITLPLAASLENTIHVHIEMNKIYKTFMVKRKKILAQAVI